MYPNFSVSKHPLFFGSFLSRFSNGLVSTINPASRRFVEGPRPWSATYSSLSTARRVPFGSGVPDSSTAMLVQSIQAKSAVSLARASNTSNILSSSIGVPSELIRTSSVPHPSRKAGFSWEGSGSWFMIRPPLIVLTICYGLPTANHYMYSGVRYEPIQSLISVTIHSAPIVKRTIKLHTLDFVP